MLPLFSTLYTKKEPIYNPVTMLQSLSLSGTIRPIQKNIILNNFLTEFINQEPYFVLHFLLEDKKSYSYFMFFNERKI